MNWDYYKSLLCDLGGHKPPIRIFERGNEDCDCGADHTYLGCPRCRQNLEEFD